MMLGHTRFSIVIVSALLLFQAPCDAYPTNPDEVKVSDGLVVQALPGETIFKHLAQLAGRERRAVDFDNEAPEDTFNFVAPEEFQMSLMRNKREPGSVLDKARDAISDMKDGVTKAGKQASNIARNVMDSAQRSGKAAMNKMKDVGKTGSDIVNNMKRTAERTIGKASGG